VTTLALILVNSRGAHPAPCAVAEPVIVPFMVLYADAELSASVLAYPVESPV
jgi:hypothetical protein